jgi:2'-5' RNA ligase
MPFAITLCLDSCSSGVVGQMWRTLAERGIDTDRHRLDYPAHITLAIYPDSVPSDRLGAALSETTTGWKPLRVTLTGLGVFPAPSSTLWAIPVVMPTLLERHAAIQAALPELRADQHYNQNEWVPHITLSGPLPDPVRALAALLLLWQPLSGSLDRVELVRFRPVEVLHSRVLSY